ncbi:MAG: lipocalin-like domain-containing protein [Pseudomonadota bacterium]|nr:lipocalin-like domain-containing protein [Pseudomonadota bacterium]
MSAEGRRRALRLLGALAVTGAASPAALLGRRASAQGYAGLGAAADGYSAVVEGRRFAFPRDRGPHPDFRIEWWYVTANLSDADGRAYGAQWTLFRQAVSPDPGLDGWASPQIWMGHAAVTSARRHLTAEKFGRGGVGQAGAVASPFRAWIDDWRLESLGADFSPLRLKAGGRGFSYDLALQAEGPEVLQGRDGYSVKSESGQASYYYSAPFLRASGELRFGGERVEVQGRAWLDREWSSQPLEADQPGWDWFALHLDGGAKLMLYRMRRVGSAPYLSAAWIGPDGRVERLDPAGVTLAPASEAEVAGRRVPSDWTVEIPSRGLALIVEPVNRAAWMDMSFPYWEGPVRVDGSVAGVGYMELTGY